MGFVIRLPLKTVTISRFTILSSSSVWGLTHLVVGQKARPATVRFRRGANEGNPLLAQLDGREVWSLLLTE